MGKNRGNFIIIFLIFVICACLIFIRINNEKKAIEVIKDNKVQEEVREIAKIEENDFKNIKELQLMNSDIVGWINIPNTLIDYPIVKSLDNEFYLDKSVKKEIAKEGSIFMDYINNSDFSDRNTVLYGHNMAGDTMFGGLRFYRDKSYLDEHPIIKIYTENQVLEYEIFSVYVSKPDYEYRTKIFGDDSEFEAFINRIEEPSIIESDIDLINIDKVITLSTCAFDFYDARLAVHAKLININENGLLQD